ncbi:hypothetical protein HPG69_010214 [Diceros bicornis minor]|uniref:Uncharacterized protein n=1 Tax=Diceros bicornis minor TaxID=77932 RepID=A0A7J7EE45_DICBM|nr:hypothetical protein HPG69_010214 [Diceros bicornis minor]
MTRTGGSRGRTRIGECSPGPGAITPNLPQATVPTLLHAETLWVPPQYSSPPVQGEVMEGADNQDEGEQGRPVRWNMYQSLETTVPRGLSLLKDILERTAMKKARKVKERRPKGSSHLGVGTTSPSTINAVAQKTLKPPDGKEIKAANPLAENSFLQRLNRMGLSKCRLTVSTIISLVIQQEEMNMKFQR